MAESLAEIRDGLKQASDQLLDERDTAAAAGESAKVAVAEAEFDRIAVVLTRVQAAINQQLALNLDAVAARLQDSIEAQRAIGLATAAATLAELVAGIRGSPRQPPGPAEPGPGPSPAPVREPSPDQPAPGMPAPDPTSPSAGSAPMSSSVLRAKPGRHQEVIDKLIAGAQAQDLDPIAVLTIVAIESDFNPTATNPVSSAGGLFQFLDDTWTSNGGETFPGRGGNGNGQAAAAPIDEQVRIGCRYVANTIRSLADHLGPTPTLTAIYMAHQQGMTGALRILTANLSAPIESVIGDRAARNNRLNGLNVAQVKAKFDSVVRSQEDEARSLVTTGPQAAARVAGSVPTTSIAAKAVHVALTEMEMFARRNGIVILENQPPLSQRVLEYFRLAGRPDIVDPSAEPWSAAFMSFVMSNAGATPQQFPISPSHHRYILLALANRMDNRLDAPIVYFDRDEMAPRTGDLIGFSRTAAIKNRADLERFLPDNFFPSHTDLVIDVTGSRIKAIGGNVSQTIMTSTVTADAGGRIDPTDAHFFVLRLNI
jgi:hypothetical protein